MPDVLYERKGHIAVITLNRPEARNAFTWAMLDEIAACWKRYADEDDAWVAIFTGAGDHFCAGMDLKKVRQDKEAGTFTLPKPGDFSRIESPKSLGSYKPVIGAIKGSALAGGCNFAMICDLVVAAEDAQFGVTEPRWNLSGPWAAALTPHIGIRNAIEMTIYPRFTTAQRAKEMGFVNWVVPKEKVMDKAMEVAEAILECGPGSVAAFLETYYRTWGMPWPNSTHLGAHIQKSLKNMEDSLEGPRAFAEKRKPAWKNR